MLGMGVGGTERGYSEWKQQGKQSEREQIYDFSRTIFLRVVWKCITEEKEMILVVSTMYREIKWIYFK